MREPLEQLEQEADSIHLTDDQAMVYSIAISLKRIADDMKEIKNGMSFICERWKS